MSGGVEDRSASCALTIALTIACFCGWALADDTAAEPSAATAIAISAGSGAIDECYSWETRDRVFVTATDVDAIVRRFAIKTQAAEE